MLTLITTVFADSAFSYAASKNANLSLWYASAKNHGVISEFNSNHTGSIFYAMIDGHSAYCMNHGLAVSGGQLMGSDDKSGTDLTNAQEKLLAYCMYFGFSSTETKEPTNAQRNKYVATQAMVWVIVNGLFGKSSGDTAAGKLCDCAPAPKDAKSYYETLKKNINASNSARRPSFASKAKADAKTVELKWNESNKRYEHTFTDSNEVLGNFDFSIEGFKSSKSGNKLTVYSDSVNDKATAGTFNSNIGAVETTTSCIFWLTGNSGDQEFVSEQPKADPVKAYIKVKTESLGYGEITKTDNSTGAKLKRAVYGIYSDSACTALVDSMTTDGNGYAKSKALAAGTYYVKEITAPAGYVISNTVHTLKVTAGNTTGITLTDVEQLGSITIYKEGEVLSGWNGSNFTYETKKLPGAVFRVTAGADIYRADGTKVYNAGDVVADNLVSGSDGQAVLSDLHLGTYMVTETKSIDGYSINEVPQSVNIAYSNQNVTVQSESATITNFRQKAEVNVYKKDSDTGNPLAGGQYTMYAGNDIKNYAGTVIMPKGSAIQTATTGADGKAVFTVDLPISNDFYISESLAPVNYVRNSSDVYSFRFKVMPEYKSKEVFEYAFKNDRTKAKIKLAKVDKETGKAVPQGDAKLGGAVYGLYAREDIVHPDGKTGVLYKKGTLVSELTTDSKGAGAIDNLYLGKYYVKEITPPEGYLADETEHDVVCGYEGDLIPEVVRNTTSKEQVIKQPFQLIKVSDNGDDTEAALLKGAGFSAYLKSSLKKNTDGTYDFKNAEPVVIGENNAKSIFTDEKGHAVSIPLPYGTYIVLETKTPHNMETVKPFEVKIDKNNPATPQTWRVFIDREFRAKLRVVKKDSDTKKAVLVPGAEFRIFNTDKGEYVKMITTYPSKVTHTSFITDEDGDLILPEALKAGNYRIEEIKAPAGYVVNETPVNVSVDSDTAYETDPETYEAVITCECEDIPVRGELTVEKKGEILDGYKEDSFVYREGSLAGAKFEVYAAEDIYTADMQKDSNGNRIKYYSEGQLIDTLVTGNDGKAVLKNLPLGKYKVAEVEAPHGYVLNKEEQYVTFAYVDDHTPVIYESVTFRNERQKVSLSIEKKDSGTDEAISGAVFGLYAKEDIVNADGKIIVEADTLLEEAVSDRNGMVTFKKDYPFAGYYAEEIEAPDGYVSSDETISFDTQYKGQDIKVAKYTGLFKNTPTTTKVSKIDAKSGVAVSGAALAVIDEDGNEVETWITDADKPHVIKKLVVDETYILREKAAPYGYLKAKDIEFTVKDTEEVQSVVMKDKSPTGSIVINKDGEFLSDRTMIQEHWYDFIFDFFKAPLSGVTFEVYAAEDILSPDGLDTVYYSKDEPVATIETDEDGIAQIHKLPLGKYYLVETKTLPGYVLDGKPVEADLSYVDQDTEVVYAGMEISNERQRVRITVSKTDAETKQPLKGAAFGLFAKENILNANGRVIVSAGERIEKNITGDDGTVTFISDIPLGQYYVKEIEAPAGYAASDEIFDVDASYKGDKVSFIEYRAEFENEPIRVEFSKTDDSGETEIEGAELSVIDSEGNVVETWTTKAGESHMITRLPVGNYILREESAPYGYRVAGDMEFEVAETEEIQSVTMEDEKAVGKIVIEKTDSVTKKPIEGVKFEICDENGMVVDTLVTDKKGHAESKELPICIYDEDGTFLKDIHYSVRETKAAKGYILDETAHDVVLQYDDDAPECVVYTLKLTNKPTKRKLPQTGDDYNPWFFAGFGAVSLLTGLFVALRKRKDRKTA